MNRAERLERDRLLALARKRALNQLADLHPSQYVILVDAECAELGIEPPFTRNGRPPGS